MEYIYSVQANTVIDGGAPGNFSLCLCNTREEAEKYIALMNEALPLIAKQDQYVITESKFSSGYKENFQNAIQHSTGNIIFLSDQDDVWVKGKVKRVMKEFENPEVACVIHDSFHADANLNIINSSTFSLRGGVRVSFLGNLYRLSYIGCCMAFRAEYLSVILPIPDSLDGHDWWIGSILSIGKTKMVAIQEPLIYHRQHGGNTTPTKRPSASIQIKRRISILLGVILRYGKKIMLDKQIF